MGAGRSCTGWGSKKEEYGFRWRTQLSRGGPLGRFLTCSIELTLWEERRACFYLDIEFILSCNSQLGGWQAPLLVEIAFWPRVINFKKSVSTSQGSLE